MNWPEAFATVGILSAFCFVSWVLMWGVTRSSGSSMRDANKERKAAATRAEWEQEQRESRERRRGTP